MHQHTLVAPRHRYAYREAHRLDEDGHTYLKTHIGRLAKAKALTSGLKAQM